MPVAPAAAENQPDLLRGLRDHGRSVMEDVRAASEILPSILSVSSRARGSAVGRATITIREDDVYRGVLAKHLTEDDVIPNVELIRRHRRVLGCQEGGTVRAILPSRRDGRSASDIRTVVGLS